MSRATKSLLTAVLALTLTSSGCLKKSFTYYPVKSGDPDSKMLGASRKTLDVFPMSNLEVGCFTTFACNEAIDLDGNGWIDSSEFLGSNRKVFGQHETITQVLIAEPSLTGNSANGLTYKLNNPHGKTIHSRKFNVGSPRTLLTYTLTPEQKIPGSYSIEIERNGMEIPLDYIKGDPRQNVFTIAPETTTRSP